MSRWLVCDVDEGVLRHEPTRRAALDWAKKHYGYVFVGSRDSSGSGSYTYVLFNLWDENRNTLAEDLGGVSVQIIRQDVAQYGGWSPDQTPLYPLEYKPHECVARTD